jgi:hypothetical protein
MNDHERTLLPEAVLLRLKIQVERAVRPVVASLTRRMRMREELLELITRIHGEESARHPDPQLALEAALARFGDPAELARELQAGVGRWERMEAAWVMWIESWIHCRENETRWKHSVRLALLAAGLMSGLQATVLPLVFLAKGMQKSPPPVSFLVALVAFYALAFGGLAFIGSHATEALRRKGTRWWSCPQLWLASVLAAVVVQISGMGLVLSVSFDPADVLNAARHWLLCSPVVILLFVGVQGLMHQEYLRLRDWVELKLD